MNIHRTDPAVDRLWDEFHQLVTMSREELRRRVPEGDPVLGVLGKRKLDITPEDLAVMRRTVDRILDLLSVRAAAGGAADRWRRDLMNLGHDPHRDHRF
jgi:hypothetical protein